MPHFRALSKSFMHTCGTHRQCHPYRMSRSTSVSSIDHQLRRHPVRLLMRVTPREPAIYRSEDQIQSTNPLMTARRDQCRPPSRPGSTQSQPINPRIDSIPVPSTPAPPVPPTPSPPLQPAAPRPASPSSAPSLVPSIRSPAPRLRPPPAPAPLGRGPHLFHHPQPCQDKVNKSLPSAASHAPPLPNAGPPPRLRRWPRLSTIARPVRTHGPAGRATPFPPPLNKVRRGPACSGKRRSGRARSVPRQDRTWCTSMTLPSGSWKKIWSQPRIAQAPCRHQGMPFSSKRRLKASMSSVRKAIWPRSTSADRLARCESRPRRSRSARCTCVVPR